MDKLFVSKIQRFSTQDGPGVRTTVFLQGCPLRCKWCHNPESQVETPQFFYTDTLCVRCQACACVCDKGVHRFQNDAHHVQRNDCINCMRCVDVCPQKALERCSTPFTVEEILDVVKKDIPFYGVQGGLTLSGGEPLLHGENAIRLLMRAKENGIHTAIETCGYFDEKHIPALVKATDLFLYDVKDTVEKRHVENVGVSNAKILSNLRAIDEAGGNVVLRCIMLRGENTDKAHLDGIVALFRSLKHCKSVEIFSYHHYGESKYVSLGKAYEGKRDWIISKKELSLIRAYLKAQGVPCKIKE